MVADDVQVAVVDEGVFSVVEAELDVVNPRSHEDVDHGEADVAWVGGRAGCPPQWFRAQFGPILVYKKCQMFSFKMVFMLNSMLLLENYSPMMYFVPLKQQFCMPLSMLYFARPV